MFYKLISFFVMKRFLLLCSLVMSPNDAHFLLQPAVQMGATGQAQDTPFWTVSRTQGVGTQ